MVEEERTDLEGPGAKQGRETKKKWPSCLDTAATADRLLRVRRHSANKMPSSSSSLSSSSSSFSSSSSSGAATSCPVCFEPFADSLEARQCRSACRLRALLPRGLRLGLGGMRTLPRADARAVGPFFRCRGRGGRAALRRSRCRRRQGRRRPPLASHDGVARCRSARASRRTRRAAARGRGCHGEARGRARSGALGARSRRAARPPLHRVGHRGRDKYSCPQLARKRARGSY